MRADTVYIQPAPTAWTTCVHCLYRECCVKDPADTARGEDHGVDHAPSPDVDRSVRCSARAHALYGAASTTMAAAAPAAPSWPATVQLYFQVRPTRPLPTRPRHPAAEPRRPRRRRLRAHRTRTGSRRPRRCSASSRCPARRSPAPPSCSTPPSPTRKAVRRTRSPREAASGGRSRGVRSVGGTGRGVSSEQAARYAHGGGARPRRSTRG